ncbi:dimethylsulfoxide reductase [Photobacterium gaetbulicola]|uniref:Putative anaerobic dimethyl sulfoxide reductase subunit C n=1 Tax=Photobacterium gaetbulicola Gung47 TaxID=658445 RepID=A0A0C5WG76_9GAMM|nr:DmsC/YnfH family molybdoenzyme membrane anchor subunit [Photobacterium gaetbulicola]AJR06143.1 putative anaerobic dimethyl sulfoxide reductase subunit C [Photobacterium gaetbulicola Gung47]PSU02290.1 dimethylsulfoxide reductase [Photobacterium gaetbulicola]
MAWHEWPLILFTVLAQTAVGAYLLLGGVILKGKLCVGANYRLNQAMFFLWVLMGLGFAASTMHLGSPLRAFNALNQVGSSWLSNEIFTGSVFFALGGGYWLLEMLDKGNEALRKLLLAAGMLVGIAFMYSMIKLYLLDTVPTWNTVYTPIAFVMTMLTSGLIFGHLLLTGAQHKMAGLDRILPFVGSLAVAISLTALVSQLIGLGDIQTSVTTASELIPNMAQLQVIRVGLLLGALAVWFIPNLMNSRPGVPVMVVSFGLVFLSELVGRGIFYGLHMTVGI